MARQRFQAGIGGTLRLSLEGELPPPTSATVSIKSSTGQDLPTPVSGAAAAISPVSTTAAAPAIAGALAVTLASAVGVKAGTYLVTPASGADAFQVDVASANPGTGVVQLAAGLPSAVATGDAFQDPAAPAQGVVLSYALSGAQCPAPSAGPLVLEDQVAELPQGYGHSYRAVWTYTVDGQVVVADQIYEVRVRVLRPSLTSDQVQRELPAQWEDLVLGGAEEIAAILAEAWEDLLDDVEAKGFDPDRIMDPGRLHKAHRTLVVWKLAKTWGSAWREWAQDRKRDFDDDLTEALNSGGWYDRQADAVQTPAEVKWTSLRLTR